MEQQSVSEQLGWLIDTSISHAMRSVDRRAPIIPFVKLMRDDERVEVHRMVAERVEDGASQGRTWLSSQRGVARAVLVQEAWVQYEGRRVDGIQVAAYEAGDEKSWVLIQPFVWKGIVKKSAHPLREAYIAGLEEPLFSIDA